MKIDEEKGKSFLRKSSGVFRQSLFIVDGFKEKLICHSL